MLCAVAVLLDYFDVDFRGCLADLLREMETDIACTDDDNLSSLAFLMAEGDHDIGDAV
jgi:hypothetical protein